MLPQKITESCMKAGDIATIHWFPIESFLHIIFLFFTVNIPSEVDPATKILSRWNVGLILNEVNFSSKFIRLVSDSLFGL